MEERIKEYLIGQYGDKCNALDELSEGLIELGFLMENANDVPIRCLPGLLQRHKELLELCFKTI